MYARKEGIDNNLTLGYNIIKGVTMNAKEAARLMGSIKSEKKASSSKRNGKLGGRPKSRKNS